MGNTFERIYHIVKQIPKGRVATYGMIATLCGNPRWSQVVGFALHTNPDNDTIPCHRVVNRFGEVADAYKFGGGNIQRIILENEGVEFMPDGRVDMKKYLWDCSDFTGIDNITEK